MLGGDDSWLVMVSLDREHRALGKKQMVLSSNRVDGDVSPPDRGENPQIGPINHLVVVIFSCSRKKPTDFSITMWCRRGAE